jgi:protein-S-isoprenylcysteine O-methyltransferase Ste14
MNEPGTINIIDSVIAFLFSLATTGALTWLVWRVMNRLISGMLGSSIGFIGSLFAAALVLVSGLKVSVDFLARYQKIYILQGMLAGIIDTLNACITPKGYSPLEFIIMVSFGIYICYWLHTRFAPKHHIEDIKQKLERTIEYDEEGDRKPQYPY